MSKAYMACAAALYGKGEVPSTPKKAARPRNNIEAHHQMQLHAWLTKLSILHYHVPNGGYRRKIEAYQLKMMGVAAGVPDIVVPIAKKPYHGLYIELKADSKSVISPSQKWWHHELVMQKMKVCVSCSIEDSKKVVTEYLSFPSW